MWQDVVQAVADEAGAAGWLLATLVEDEAGVVRFHEVGQGGTVTLVEVARKAYDDPAPPVVFDWHGYWAPDVPRSAPNTVLTLAEIDARCDPAVGGSSQMRSVYDRAGIVDQLRVLLFDEPNGVFLGWLGFLPEPGVTFDEASRGVVQRQVMDLIAATRAAVASFEGRVTTRLTTSQRPPPPTHRVKVMARGEGRVALVTLPGLPQLPSSMDTIVDGVATKILRVHPPGYEGGPTPQLPYDWDVVAAGIERALWEAHDGPVALVGVSGGAYRALQLAVRGRLDVVGLFLLGPVDGLATDAEREGFRQFADVARSHVPVGELFLSRVVTAATAAAHPEIAGVVQAWFDAVPSDILASELETFADRPLLRDQVGVLSVPTVLRVGSEDVAAPPAYARALHDAMPHADLQIVPGVGHGLMWEDLEGTRAALGAWWREVAG